MGDNNQTRYDDNLHVAVTEDQKQEWKTEAKASTEYENLSQLVRLAVTREIAASNPARNNAGEVPAELQQSIADMTTVLDSIDARLQSVEQRLSQLEVETDNDTLDIQQHILQALPTPPKGEETPFGEQISAEESQLHKWAASVPVVASKVNADEETVEKALDQLCDVTAIVQCRRGGDSSQKWYFRRE